MTRWAAGLSLLLLAVPSFAQTIEVAGKSFSLKDLQSRLKAVTVKIDDPNYLEEKSFEGFSLPGVLKLAGVEEFSEIQFTSIDGFAPFVSADRLKAHKAYLVFKESTGPFKNMKKGKGEMSPSPYYLIWEGGAKLKFEVPWPYQLVKIEAIDWKKKYASILPDKMNEAEARGFALFKAQCLSCHSINLQGGEVGPELNVPRNVTEYWKPKELRAFIRDASSFRAKSKMTRFTHLTGRQIEDLVAYLAAMAKAKM